ncbi:DUF3781 domain-containing protein [Levilactobacillus brevis]|uniref:DUF3781 domain-containing protein n=1 Tax=Levilactobacillus brevis TaxID=1580 RepID=UPI0022E5D18E|nr:DUF3781 domain-containing protein [Levilactobacillus brevis]
MTNETVFLEQFRENVCYTDLVYQRVNKKLKIALSRDMLETLVLSILADASTLVEKRGKNYYVTNQLRRVRLTITSYSFRLITAD